MARLTFCRVLVLFITYLAVLEVSPVSAKTGQCKLGGNYGFSKKGNCACNGVWQCYLNRNRKCTGADAIAGNDEDSANASPDNSDGGRKVAVMQYTILGMTQTDAFFNLLFLGFPDIEDALTRSYKQALGPRFVGINYLKLAYSAVVKAGSVTFELWATDISNDTITLEERFNLKSHTTTSMASIGYSINTASFFTIAEVKLGNETVVEDNDCVRSYSDLDETEERSYKLSFVVTGSGSLISLASDIERLKDDILNKITEKLGCEAEVKVEDFDICVKGQSMTVTLRVRARVVVDVVDIDVDIEQSVKMATTSLGLTASQFIIESEDDTCKVGVSLQASYLSVSISITTSKQGKTESTLSASLINLDLQLQNSVTKSIGECSDSQATVVSFGRATITFDTSSITINLPCYVYVPPDVNVTAAGERFTQTIITTMKEISDLTISNSSITVTAVIEEDITDYVKGDEIIEEKICNIGWGDDSSSSSDDDDIAFVYFMADVSYQLTGVDFNDTRFSSGLDGFFRLLKSILAEKINDHLDCACCRQSLDELTNFTYAVKLANGTIDVSFRVSAYACNRELDNATLLDSLNLIKLDVMLALEENNLEYEAMNVSMASMVNNLTASDLCEKNVVKFECEAPTNSSLANGTNDFTVSSYNTSVSLTLAYINFTKKPFDKKGDGFYISLSAHLRNGIRRVLGCACCRPGFGDYNNFTYRKDESNGTLTIGFDLVFYLCDEGNVTNSTGNETNWKSLSTVRNISEVMERTLSARRLTVRNNSISITEPTENAVDQANVCFIEDDSSNEDDDASDKSSDSDSDDCNNGADATATTNMSFKVKYKIKVQERNNLVEMDSIIANFTKFKDKLTEKMQSTIPCAGNLKGVAKIKITASSFNITDGSWNVEMKLIVRVKVNTAPNVDEGDVKDIIIYMITETRINIDITTVIVEAPVAEPDEDNDDEPVCPAGTVKPAIPQTITVGVKFTIKNIDFTAPGVFIQIDLINDLKLRFRNQIKTNLACPGSVDIDDYTTAHDAETGTVQISFSVHLVDIGVMNKDTLIFIIKNVLIGNSMLTQATSFVVEVREYSGDVDSSKSESKEKSSSKSSKSNENLDCSSGDPNITAKLKKVDMKFRLPYINVTDYSVIDQLNRDFGILLSNLSIEFRDLLGCVGKKESKQKIKVKSEISNGGVSITITLALLVDDAGLNITTKDFLIVLNTTLIEAGFDFEPGSTTVDAPVDVPQNEVDDLVEKELVEDEACAATNTTETDSATFLVTVTFTMKGDFKTGNIFGKFEMLRNLKLLLSAKFLKSFNCPSLDDIVANTTFNAADGTVSVTIVFSARTEEGNEYTDTNATDAIKSVIITAGFSVEGSITFTKLIKPLEEPTTVYIDEANPTCTSKKLEKKQMYIHKVKTRCRGLKWHKDYADTTSDLYTALVRTFDKGLGHRLGCGGLKLKGKIQLVATFTFTQGSVQSSFELGTENNTATPSDIANEVNVVLSDMGMNPDPSATTSEVTQTPTPETGAVVADWIIAVSVLGGLITTVIFAVVAIYGYRGYQQNKQDDQKLKESYSMGQSPVNYSQMPPGTPQGILYWREQSPPPMQPTFQNEDMSPYAVYGMAPAQSIASPYDWQVMYGSAARMPFNAQQSFYYN